MMQANETHISLETVKLLKDCGIDSKYIFVKYFGADDDDYCRRNSNEIGCTLFQDTIPAYTRQEILREHAEEFFGKERLRKFFICVYVLLLLQIEKYQEADLYFRKNCVLIK